MEIHQFNDVGKGFQAEGQGCPKIAPLGYPFTSLKNDIHYKIVDK